MNLLRPRYQTAQTFGLPGSQLFWKTVLNQSDIFAYNTANEGKGGPFGAQLWLVNCAKDKYVLAGTIEEPENSNAVVSKGRASAHAEAENLSPEKRQELFNFLEDHQGEGWQIVQVSSGESCPSCRSKQILLADELVKRGLIDKGDFHVVFKATYDQTKRDADFNDAPYDQAFRAIHGLGVLSSEEGLFGLEKILKADDVASSQIKSGELIYNPVELVSEAPDEVKSLMEKAGDQPFAVIVATDGSIVSYGIEKRDFSHDKINQPEKTAIVRALYKAAEKLRKEEGKFEAWNLEGARLFTNIRDIGPMAYSESLWYNLSDIKVVGEFTSDIVDTLAQEIPGIFNKDLFVKVAADYDDPLSPLKVIFNGDPEEASVAHLLWKAKMAMEGLKNQQSERLSRLADDGSPVEFQYIDGRSASLSDLIISSDNSSHYNGKQADPS